MDFEETLKQAELQAARDRRMKAEKGKEDKARQHQSAVLLKKLGEDVISACRSRNLPFYGVATIKQRDSFFRGISYSFTLVKYVWQFGGYQIDESGQICLADKVLGYRRSGEEFKKALERDRSKASERFGVKNLVHDGKPLVPVAHVNLHHEYIGPKVGIGDDGQLYREGHQEPLRILLARSLAS